MNDKINIVVFSRNRASQLDLLLKSLKTTFKEFNNSIVNVIYDFTNMEFYEGYEILKKETFENVKFYTDKEFGSFKQTLFNVLDSEKYFTMFLCDDIIFSNNWSISDKEIQILKHNQKIIATSLRLWEGIDFCYSINQKTPPPSFDGDNVWSWIGLNGDWGYPMSVDGNVFRTEDIMTKIAAVMFSTPNELEAVLAATADQNYPLYVCYRHEPKLFNIPANIVQTKFMNRHANIKTADNLNYLFLDGKRLDEKFYFGKKFNTVHVELDLKVKD
jgi:hypothetical protein